MLAGLKAGYAAEEDEVEERRRKEKEAQAAGIVYRAVIVDR